MVYFVIAAVSILFGGISSYFFFNRKKRKKGKEDEAMTLMESVRKVCKMVTVEGDFTEIMDHTEKKKVFFNLIKQNKKMLLIIKAKAMVGFDLSKLSFIINEEKRTLTIASFPKPEILSIETDIKYYDIQESKYNKFTAEDFTRVNNLAKKNIRTRVLKSKLPKVAVKQSHEIISTIKDLTSVFGWNLIVLDSKNNKPAPKNLLNK